MADTEIRAMVEEVARTHRARRDTDALVYFDVFLGELNDKARDEALITLFSWMMKAVPMWVNTRPCRNCGGPITLMETTKRPQRLVWRHVLSNGGDVHPRWCQSSLAPFPNAEAESRV